MPNVAATVRQDKEKNPSAYCRDPRCLWKVVTRFGDKPCKNHPTTKATSERET